MSNLPENENLNNITETEAEELSTVFSAPAEHKKQANNKGKKRWPKAVAAALAVAVLIGGTVAVVQLIPEREDDAVSTPLVEDIKVQVLLSSRLLLLFPNEIFFEELRNRHPSKHFLRLCLLGFHRILSELHIS